MTALVILAAVVLALVLLGQIRLGAAVDYTAQGLRVRIKAGPLRIQAYPRPPRSEKPQRRKKKKKEPDKPKEKASPLAQLRQYLPLITGGANAAVGMIWPLVEQNFNVKDRDIRTRVDFNAQRPEVALSAAATLTVAQAISLALRLAAGFLKLNSQSNSGAKAPARQKEAV